MSGISSVKSGGAALRIDHASNIMIIMGSNDIFSQDSHWFFIICPGKDDDETYLYSDLLAAYEWELAEAREWETFQKSMSPHCAEYFTSEGDFYGSYFQWWELVDEYCEKMWPEVPPSAKKLQKRQKTERSELAGALWEEACLEQAVLDGAKEKKDEGSLEVPDFYSPNVFHRLSSADAFHEQEWKQEAESGMATSAGKSKLLTPSPRVAYFDVPEDTPEKIPAPMKKSLLVADRKLQVEMKKNESKAPKGNDKGAEPEKTPGPSRGETKVTGENDDKTKAKAKPKPRCGPMQPAMKEFINKHRQKGMNYEEARNLWLESKERAKIVGQVSEAERRKRRW